MSIAFLFVVGPLAVAVLAGFVIIRRGFQLKRLLADGVEGRGTVVRKVRFGGGRPHFTIRYQYVDADGGVHSHKSNVTRDVWNAVEEGSSIPIVYSASRPSISAPLDLVHQARSAYTK